MSELIVKEEPTNLLAKAIESGASIETIEKMVELQERWEANQARKIFFSALSDFQNECPDLRKTKKVSFSTSKGNTEYHYAPLADIDRQIKPLLKKHGFSKRWEISDVNGKTRVKCLISHDSGHIESTEMESNSDTSGSKNEIQAKGSAIEYMKRYTLIGALGLTTADTDIDGRMPELDIDKLHKQYMEVYNQIVAKDESYLSTMDPDNWAADRTPQLYVKAIGKAREILAKLTTLKQ